MRNDVPIVPSSELFRMQSWVGRIGERAWRETRDTVTRVRDRLDLNPTLTRIRPYSMLPEGRLVQLARDVRHVFEADIPGAFVECGVWRGGASFLMADLIRRRGARGRKVWMFDSFEGLPPAGSVRRIADFREG